MRSTSRTIDFDTIKIIANIKHRTRNIFRQAIQIEKRPNKQCLPIIMETNPGQKQKRSKSILRPIESQ